MTAELLEEIKYKAIKVCQELGYSLYSIEYHKENGMNLLSVAIDNNFNINMEDIEKFTEIFSPMLDEYDPVMEDYYLDVSSPGAYRKVDISDLDKVINLFLKIVLKDDKEIKGDFIELLEDALVIKVNNKGRIKNHTIKFDDIKQINTDVK